MSNRTISLFLLSSLFFCSCASDQGSMEVGEESDTSVESFVQGYFNDYQGGPLEGESGAPLPPEYQLIEKSVVASLLILDVISSALTELLEDTWVEMTEENSVLVGGE